MKTTQNENDDLILTFDKNIKIVLISEGMPLIVVLFVFKLSILSLRVCDITRSIPCCKQHNAERHVSKETSGMEKFCETRTEEEEEGNDCFDLGTT